MAEKYTNEIVEGWRDKRTDQTFHAYEIMNESESKTAEEQKKMNPEITLRRSGVQKSAPGSRHQGYHKWSIINAYRINWVCRQ